MASRMESTGVPGKIQISQEMYNQLQFSEMQFKTEARSPFEVKGKGVVQTYFLTDMTSESVLDNVGERLSFFNENESQHPLQRSSQLSFRQCLSPRLMASVSRLDFFPARRRRHSLGGSSAPSAHMEQFGTLNESQPASKASSKASASSVCSSSVSSSTSPMESVRKQRRHSNHCQVSRSMYLTELRRVCRTPNCGGQHDSGSIPSVLLVDKSASTLMQYRRVLSSSGVHVLAARTYKEGIDFMKKCEFSVVFIDLNMTEAKSIHQFRRWEKIHCVHRQLVVGLICSTLTVDMESLKLSGYDYLDWKTNRAEKILQYIYK
mmetsp:Transcript_34554/g.47894  ORF Transcript_34554/g.47894 Transcript_34554/m.47894 type:complete len:320 (-) Transcript_34554:72-1031(-)|eukprot:CAMPEP_0196576590 /NCGR_PEP_ID=MMETSP1081-20130531/5805_1 /TAXON_ID=36882 /ORGANISM="Pyramimonas amylifera, Strain CCMP720" /LENGTH=319 /DNA_ID=CAMNT_0041895233 /DNA_START=1042 /DNA_END=2001 /DNA_ORIENTATION=-